MRLDSTGKVVLDHIYDRPDPRPYFTTLRQVDYVIPQLAKAYFSALIREYRHARGVRRPKVLDVGCSYGINAALLRHDLTMDDLYDRYRDADGLSRAELLALDRGLAAAQHGTGVQARYAGLDVSAPALDYAVAAGFLDEAVCADLESGDPTAAQRAALADTDIVISTGCLGYLGAPTLTRIAQSCGDRPPWMAHFVLRMFPFEPIAAELDGLGYETLAVPGVFRQRRFAAPEERERVLHALDAQGVDTTGVEDSGWFYAQLFVSRPVTSNATVKTVNTKIDERAELSPRTFGNEDRLPRVPLPSLDDSCTRFLRWCTPLLTAEQLAQTTAAVEAFRAADSPARALHAELERYNADPAVHSWLDDFWDTRYLGRRDRIALNANFFFLFADTTQRRLDRAVGLIAGALDYKLRLDAELVTPAVQRGAPLSMHQYRYLFGTTRIPHEVQDTARTPYSASEPGPSTARHIVVFHRGAIFRMDVFDPDGRPHAAEDLAAGLEELLKTAVPAEVSAGAFTTMARAEWAARRTVLLADPTNAAALETIETALFCLALDEDVYDNRTAACDQLLHGDSRDRWFDKAVTFIVFADGRAGINVEHCALDGTTILGFVDAVLAVSDEVRVERLGSVPQLSPVEFALDDASRSAAADAAADFAAYAAATATTTLSFPFGSSRAKELKISPDALVQLAYQLAHRRSKGFVGATYESISTRQFHHGRTEAMRVVTPEVLAFADAMENPELDAPARRRALRAAADAHVARAKDCQAGLAPEQHLWELQFIQRRKGAELGAAAPLTLYDTPGWTVTRDDYLSTSSAPSVNIQFFGFGMTSVRCIGVGYVLLPDRFNIYLSTPRQVGDQMHAFAEELVRAVDELQALLASPDA